MLRKIKSSVTSKFLVIFILVALIILQSSYAIAAKKGDCEDGAIRCLFGAGLSTAGGAALGVGFASFCISGYIWCISYYE